ncbi:DUF2514 family protein [Pantoea sp. Cy-639]|uniref:DUF2514 family protein n=1 Tax=Pantoea sp. Cy-639 TaxID=2608360 RepID=UPI001962786B|nr:DUF2514 family protein [Pantoea sp. Cy-639]
MGSGRETRPVLSLSIRRLPRLLNAGNYAAAAEQFPRWNTRAAMVLSDLLSRADARAGELASAYDRARIAGLACEASYNALVKPAG